METTNGSGSLSGEYDGLKREISVENSSPLEDDVPVAGDKIRPTCDESDEIVGENQVGSRKTLTSLAVPTSGTNGEGTLSHIPQLLVPSLRGRLVTEGAVNICRGLWAMSDAAHGMPGQTSDFEFKLVTAADLSKGYPFSGKYHGWFTLKQPPPSKASLKIEDKELYINFSPCGDGSYKIEGHGINKFGKFNLRGSLSDIGSLQMYREYQLKPLPSPRKRSFSSAGDGDISRSASFDSTAIGATIPKLKKVKSISVEIPAAGMVEQTPREGSARARKPSAVLKEAIEIAATPRTVAAPKPATTPRAASAAPAPAIGTSVSTSTTSSAAAASGIERVKRPPVAMTKCADLLKELMKLPLAMWFLEPVDPIKLNIPDYPVIVKQPMDFSTVKSNLESGAYESPDAFAEHVRLVFRNAIAYNQLRDNPVHIAARELSSRFEDRFRMLMTNYLGSIAATAAASAPEPKASRASSGGGKKSGTSKSSSSKGMAPAPKGRPSTSGPRPVEAFLPPVVDSNLQTMLEMQRRMEEMANELKTLRTQVMQSEVKSSLEMQRDAAQNPLTFDEKKALIARIHKLPSSKMESVVEIIQAAIPPESRADGEEIEIPLDELDTYTLRRLQKFVEECNAPSAGRLSSGNASRNSAASLKAQASSSSSSSAAGGRKRAEKKAIGRPSAASKVAMAASVVSTTTTTEALDDSTVGGEEIADHGEEGATASMSVHHVEADGEGEIDPDDLFFSNESFDDLRAHAAATGDLSDASDNDDDQPPPSKKAASSGQVNSPPDDDNIDDNENADTIFF